MYTNHGLKPDNCLLKKTISISLQFEHKIKQYVGVLMILKEVNIH